MGFPSLDLNWYWLLFQNYMALVVGRSWQPVKLSFQIAQKIYWTRKGVEWEPSSPQSSISNDCCIILKYLSAVTIFICFVEEGSDVSLCCDPCGLVLPPSLHGPSLFSWLDGPVRRGLPPLNLSKNKYLVFGFGISIWYLSQRFTWIILE